MKERVNFNLAFLDMLFNMLIAFSFLFLMSFLLIRPPAETKKPGVEMKAEFILTLSWPDGSLDDIDLWLKLPDGKYINYLNKDTGVVTLDRDDRGGATNSYIDGEGDIQIQPDRREIITIRALIPGRYVVNANVFSVVTEHKGIKSQKELPYEVEATLVKLNPSVKDIAKQKIMMRKWREEHTLFAFTINDKGEVINIETDVQEPFIGSQKVFP